MSDPPPTALAQAVAAALLAGAWTERAMLARLRQAVSPLSPALERRIVVGVRSAYPRPPLDRPRELAAVVDGSVIGSGRRPGRWPRAARVRRRYAPTTTMRVRPWPVAALDAVDDVRRLLGVASDGELEWLADVRGLERTVADERLRGYRYTAHPRPAGPARVLERPKRRLKQAQRTLLREVIGLIPPHDAACGFVAGRSVLTHAERHVGQAVVLRFDLEDFFAQVAAGRVFGILRTAGYAEPVAHLLTGLMTNAVPLGFWDALPRPTTAAEIARHHRLGRRLATPHLPQGAPTSPALANLAAFRFDRRLDGLARAVGARYSRYADDLALSGGRQLARRADALAAQIGRIAAEEGFALNPGKSRVLAREGRQALCGVVVNARPNVDRRDYDRLKALLHEAERHGPAVADRTAIGERFADHVRGRVAWVAAIHPERGARLRARFERIDWTATTDARPPDRP